MKKQLLSTSALVAAGMIASAGTASAQTAPASSPIQVTVGGYMYQFFSYTSQDNRENASQIGLNATLTAKPVKMQVNNDAEIWFQGKTTLANGISVAMRVELEANTEGDQIDESFAIVEGAFGRIEIGSTDNAAYKMSIHAPEAAQGIGGVAGAGVTMAALVSNPTRQGANDSPMNNTLPRMLDNDSEKISYYTPRFEGFQLGASYIPELTQDRGGLVPRLQSSTVYNRGLALGVNFTRAFGPIDIAASGGWDKWKKPVLSQGFSNNATWSDPSAYSFGLQVGYAGFRVGGSYLKVKDLVYQGTAAPAVAASFTGVGLTGATDAFINGSSWDVGLTYTFGPAVVGISYFQGKNQTGTSYANAGVDKQKSLSVAGRYQLGPGVQVQAAVFQVRIEGDPNLPTNSGSSQSFDNNKATGITTGLLLNF